MAGSCEHGNDLPGFIKGVKFCDKLSDYKLLNSDCAP
jgi:hypothetical protein